jgi:GntR family histidine utilization transcriptional repressor
VRRATLEIPVIRHEIEGRGLAYRYALLDAARLVPPPEIQARMQTPPRARLLHVVSLHLADGKPYVFEDRWLNPEVVPRVLEVDFAVESANEWLVVNVPFEGGDIALSAIGAGPREAEILGCRTGEGLFVADRSTWTAAATITSVRLVFAPGYRMHTEF